MNFLRKIRAFGKSFLGSSPSLSACSARAGLGEEVGMNFALDFRAGERLRGGIAEVVPNGVLLHVSASRIRDYDLGVDNSINNLVVACRVSDCGRDIDSMRQSLTRFYNVFHPKNALELVGLTAIEAPGLQSQPGWTAPHPWLPGDAEVNLRNMRKAITAENQLSGPSDAIFEGCAWCGPVNAAKIEVEIRRLSELAESIRTTGYHRNNGPDGDIQGILLMNDEGEMSIQIYAGAHRAAVLSALEYSLVPVKIINVVYRSDVKLWPNVLSGMYTEDGALKKFDRFVVGLPQLSLQNWSDHITCLK